MGFLKNLMGGANRKTSEKKAFGGMSPDELYALNDQDFADVLDEFEGLYNDINADAIKNLDNAVRNILTIKVFDAEVQNGGLGQFFVNSSSLYAPYVSESLKCLKADKIKKLYDEFILENSIDMKIFLKAGKLSNKDIENLEYCDYDSFDDKYYDLYEEEVLYERLLKYAREHVMEIVINNKMA